MSLFLLGEAEPGNDLKTTAQGEPGTAEEARTHLQASARMPVTRAVLTGAAARSRSGRMG